MKCSYSAIIPISIELLFLWNVWNLFFIFGLDPITHIYVRSKKEKVTQLKFFLFIVSLLSLQQIES